MVMVVGFVRERGVVQRYTKGKGIEAKGLHDDDVH